MSVPADYGPIYKETVYGRWPVEPYNTATTLLFLAVVLYWAWKIGKEYKEHPLIAIVLPIVGVGFIGGFLYHSLRNNYAWLLLDWVPIVAAAVITAIYFWRTFLKSWKFAALLTFAPIAAFVFVMRTIHLGLHVLSLSYAVLAVSVILPVVLYVWTHSKKGFSKMLYAILSVVAAIVLRTLDRNELMEFLPMGSHFLWHTFGAMTCYFFIDYVYEQKPHIRPS